MNIKKLINSIIIEIETLNLNITKQKACTLFSFHPQLTKSSIATSSNDHVIYQSHSHHHAFIDKPLRKDTKNID
ncbi:unnamed protein product [Amoebophrya sp. A25]|nr:unnamed protein product [Amoebophrya sp. A25]|eukprot:GSA25T00003673001.1